MRAETLSLPAEPNRPWWREPMVWLIAGLPLTAVIAGLTTVWIASRNADSLVKEGYLKEGFAVQGIQEQDRAAARMGITATLQFGAGTMQASLDGSTPEGRWPSLLLLTLAHPTEPSQDRSVALKLTGRATYQADLPALLPGRRQLILESHEQGWRLMGIWDAPASGSLHLAPPSAEQ